MYSARKKKNAHSTNALCTAFTYIFLSVMLRRCLSLPLLLLGASATVTLGRARLLQIVATFNKKSSFKITYVCDNEHDVKYRWLTLQSCKHFKHLFVFLAGGIRPWLFSEAAMLVFWARTLQGWRRREGKKWTVFI